MYFPKRSKVSGRDKKKLEENEDKITDPDFLSLVL